MKQEKQMTYQKTNGISENNESGGTAEKYLPNCSLATTWQINCNSPNVSRLCSNVLDQFG